MQNEARFLTITQAAELLRVSSDTLRRWEKKGIVTPQRTKGGVRRYTLMDLKIAKLNKRKSRFLQLPSLANLSNLSNLRDLKVAFLTSFLWIISILIYQFLAPIFLRPTNSEQRIVSDQLNQQSNINKKNLTP